MQRPKAPEALYASQKPLKLGRRLVTSLLLATTLASPPVWPDGQVPRFVGVQRRKGVKDRSLGLLLLVAFWLPQWFTGLCPCSAACASV